MSKTSNVQHLRIADAARAIRHVFIRDLEVLAHIGIHGHEQGLMQPVRINVDLAVEDLAVLEDRLDSVVDYEKITQKIRAIIAKGHINLRVEKLHALPGAVSAGVEIERERP